MKEVKSKIAIILIVLFALVSCKTNSSETNEKRDETHETETTSTTVILSKQQQDALKLKIGGLETRNLTTVVKINGQLEVAPGKKAEITTFIGGNVKSIKVFEGDKVQKGQVLAVLEHPDIIKLQEDFAIVANNLEFLKQEYKRQKELYDNNVGAGKDYQKAKTDYDVAKAKYEALKKQLLLLHLSPDKVKNGQISGTVSILSPIAGYVNEVNVKLGTFVDNTTEMFEITDNSAIHADFLVYEKDIHLLKTGQEIHFTIANRMTKEYTATIFAIGKNFDPDVRAVHIHAKIKGNTENLIPGMYVTGHLHTDENYTQALPDDAIVRQGTKYYVFKVIDSTADATTFEKTEVITGSKDDGYTEVQFVENISPDTKFAINQAYYLLADLGKDELGDDD